MSDRASEWLRALRVWAGKKSSWEVAAAIVTVLTFIGGGIAWFWPSKESPPPSTTVTATNGVAINGNVTNSAVINIAGIEKLTPEQIAALMPGPRGDDAETRKRIEDLSRQTGVTESALGTFFHILGENEVPPERLSATLVDIAKRYVEFRERLATLPTNGESERRVLSDAQVAIDKGDFDRAETLLRGLEEAQAKETNQARRNQATTRAERARLSALRLDRLAAAEHYRVAAELTPNEDAAVQAGYLIDSADALREHGDERGDNDALRSSIDRHRHALTLVSRERDRDVWARAQNNLGTALSDLGGRESGPTRLEEAVSAYRSALLERTRERVPLDWAMTQNNLGGALEKLGERDKGPHRLEEAVSAYRSALEEWTRERVPLLWATTQKNLGSALQMLGERDSGKARLEDAFSAYQSALQEFTRERVPLDWAETQNNIGATLLRISERESVPDRLEEAVSAFRSALMEFTRERVPLDWALTQNNLGCALQMLGEREGGPSRLEEAVSAFRSALQERTRGRVPRDWAMTQNNLGLALGTLGERESGPGRFEEAVLAYWSALQELTRERGPVQWAMIQGNLSFALSALAERTRDVDTAKTALATIDDALAVFAEAKAEYHVDTGSRIRDRAVAVLNELQADGRQSVAD